jgi:glucosyl-3-phosphoglycerate synthase
LVKPNVARWFAARTWQQPVWSVPELVAAKRGRTVSVVLPALDEQDTVGQIVTSIMPLTTPANGRLVDEVVVMDSGSTDGTPEVARAAGARVVRREEALPHVPVRLGKGEVLWRSLAATSGDLVVFIDSDLVDFDASFVSALLGPLLTCADPVLVKGFYRRPLWLGSGVSPEEAGGGRVTELMARPVLASLRPDLAGIVQPLGGEYAARREFLESVPFAAGYGVEIGLLMDAHERHGLAGLAQVNLGVRKHRNRSLLQLGVMARQILTAALARSDQSGSADDEVVFTQFVQIGQEWLPNEHTVLVDERPPMRNLSERAC